MNTNNLVLNKLFTQSVFQSLVRGHENEIYHTIVQRYIVQPDGKSNGELISEIYRFMEKNYRNEYFYQNTLLNKLLLGKHSVNTTTALTQIPIGQSKADFILINGKAVVYEIKSDLDSFDRLDTQLKDYYKAFNHVCVVTSEHYFDKLLDILHNTPVGICVLTKRGTISSVLRKDMVEDNSFLNHQSIFRLLHKAEFERIVEEYYGELPHISQVFFYDACFSRFSQIPIQQAYEMAVKQLKKRNQIVSHRIENIPYELRSLIYFFNSSMRDISKVEDFLREKFRG